MDYVVAVQAPAYWLSPTRFATESAFAEHLRELRRAVGPEFERLVLVAPRFDDATYAAQRDHLGIVDLEADGIQFLPAHPHTSSRLGFWRHHARQTWRTARTAVATAGVVHSGLSTELGRPMLAMVNLAAWLAQRPVVFVVDIDFRRHSWHYYKLGRWSLKSFLVNRFVYDPMKWLQVWLAPRMFELVLLKSATMVEDFGGGRPNVKNFYDTAHGVDAVLSAAALSERLRWIVEPQRPLHIAFFGRLVDYKGLDRVIEAVRLAREQGADVRLSLIGAGDRLDSLRRQASDSGLKDVVAFLPPVRYGDDLFRLLADVHVSVAAPLVEDTPRAAFDSMARGLPVVAFDITYFRDLARASGAVALVAWPQAAALAGEFVRLARDRSRLAAMSEHAVAFARENTQSRWLEQRTQWMRQLVLPKRRVAAHEQR